MLNNILDKRRETIDMSNLFIREGDRFTIINDKEEIKEKVYNHYKNWTSKRNIDLDEIEYNEKWRNIYSPIEEIDETIYDNIMDEITLNELNEILSEAKNKKAAGISGIPYDFWKKSKKTYKTINIRYVQRQSYWNHDINLTRPITLIETARKIFLKIITRRLTKILSENKVLQPTNYAALKNESTLEPLKIIQNIIEDANVERKEAWILLMDISKAYDSVNTTMLERSLKRIKLPSKLINLIMDIRLHRRNRVIVNNETTDEYKVEDGIDQGKTWSPLLWRIFYDGLLTRLNEIKEDTGYKMKVDKIQDTETYEIEKLESIYNVSAFMDDTTLISSNKLKLEDMIEICHEFFEINDIKANVGKYELIKINNKENEDLFIKGEKITKVNHEEGNRILGIWYRHDNKRKNFKKKIKNIIDQACKIFRWKKLNEKQIIATWNMVIIPKIEYQLQAIVLTENECKTFMGTITNLVKNRAGLARSTLNFIIHEKELYGLKHIFDLQIESLTKTIMYLGNDKNRIATIFKIKIYKEQQRIWTASCVGNLETSSFNTQNSWIVETINILKKEGISICNHEFSDAYNEHKIKGSTMEIIKFLEPKEIINKKQISTKGKVPKRFKKIKEEITLENSRELKNKYINNNTRRIELQKTVYNDEEPLGLHELIAWNDQQGNIIFGEILKKSRSKAYKRIGLHLITHPDSMIQEDESPNLIKCNGCERNIGKNKDQCLIYLENNNNSRTIKKRRTENGFVKPYESLRNIAIKNEILKQHFVEELENIEFNNKIETIDQIVNASEETILKFKNNIIEEEYKIIDIIISIKKGKKQITDKGIKTYCFYATWIIKDYYTDENEIVNNTVKLIEKKDQISRIWLKSIILVLLLIKDRSTINLIIDPIVANAMNNFFNNKNERRRLDNEHYIELIYLEELIMKKEIVIDIRIVSEDLDYKGNIEKMNKTLDEKIKGEEEIDEINLEETYLKSKEFNIHWHNILITGEYRKWRKKCSDAHWKNKILNSNRLEDLFMLNFKNEFDWQYSLKFLSNRTKFKKTQCSKEDTSERAYRIKNLLKELPTYKILNERNTNGIISSICPRCEKEEEDWEHIWICEENVFNLREVIEEGIDAEITKLKNEEKKEELKIIQDLLCSFIEILYGNSIILSMKTREWELIRGIYNYRYNLITKKKEEQTLIKNLWEAIYDHIKEKIWKDRCNTVIRIEKDRGISKLDKRKRSNGNSDEQKNNKKQKKEINKNSEKEIKKNKKQENIINIVTHDKLIGKIITEGSIDKSWYNTIKIV
ncbi:hypothetical protein GLOIN_2v1824527 [Rhizophagus clarus]|uniref:Reverse transcriptase domain-containing protein n=1 Tax=Rhizophagus clarus TaxID=94130 RepID=A0A8H3M404_9GLOM|nr:hypothetical protein GLOIN_2v1824527 [Rhizophagus clarus]